MYRTKYTNPDYRREPKTQCFCAICQRDITNPGTARYIAVELDYSMEAIRPYDLPQAWEEIRLRRAPHLHNTCVVFEMIGPECAKRLGLDWTMDKPGEIPA